jgi:hypothetical protein
MTNLVNDLKAARARISEPGTWCTEVLHAHINGKVAHCAVGALGGVWMKSGKALFGVLQRRHFMGTLPTPTIGAGGQMPRPWCTLFNDPDNCTAWAIAQFNNSTSQADVLALFDEAIADNTPQPEQPKEVAPQRELEPA